MSRRFLKDTSGIGSQQYLGLGVNGVGTLIEGESAVSWHVWVKPITLSIAGSVDKNRILSTYLETDNKTSLLAHVQNNGTLRVGARSQSADAVQEAVSTSVIGTGDWISVGFVVDYANDRIKVYIGGVLETTQGVTFGSDTYTHTSASFEDSYSDKWIFSGLAPPRFHGDIAQGAFWSGDIGDAAFAQLGAGVRANEIGIAPLSYIPITGEDDPEPDLGSMPLNTNLVGSPQQGDEPPLITSVSVAGLALNNQQPLGLHVQADAAGEIRIGVGIATETDTAGAIIAISVVPVGMAESTEEAGSVAGTKVRSVGLAESVESALTVGHSKRIALGTAEERDTALGVTAVGGGAEPDEAGEYGAVPFYRRRR